MSKYSHSKSKRSVLDDEAYESSLNYVSEKGKRFASRLIARQTKGKGPHTLELSGGIAPPQFTSSTSDESTTVVIHDYVSVFVSNKAPPQTVAAPTRIDGNATTTDTSSLEPLTPSQLLIKFIGYLPIRWLETIVKAVGQEHNRQLAHQSDSKARPQRQGPEEEDLDLALPGDDEDTEREQETQMLLGLGLPETQLSRETRRKSNALAERDEKLLMVASLNATSPLEPANAMASAITTNSSTAGYMSSTVRAVPSTATPLSLLDMYLGHKQQEAANRAAATYGAIIAEQARVREQLRQEAQSINATVAIVAATSQAADALAAERDTKVQHMALIAETNERFRVASTMALLAQLIHRRGNEAKAFLVLLRLFEALAESGIAEEGRWREDVAAMDASYTAARRAEQEDERRFVASQHKHAMSIRDLLQRNNRRPTAGESKSGPDMASVASKALNRSHIPSSSSALAAKWRLRYEQRKEAVIRTIVRDTLLPFLNGLDQGALVVKADKVSPKNAVGGLELLQSSALHMFFDMYPSQSDGQALTATAMSVITAANEMYSTQLSEANLLHLGMLVDAEEGTGPMLLTESGEEVRVPWWYLPRWEIERKQERCLKLWQRFRLNSNEDAADPNEDLLPTAADIFKGLYNSHQPSTAPEAVTAASLSSAIGGEGFLKEDRLAAYMLCKKWASTVDDRDNCEDTIPTNKFPPVRPFLAFPFHVTVRLSEPAKVALKEVLVPFVEDFWASVATTSAADILAGRDARDEMVLEMARAAAAAAAAEVDSSFFGPYVNGNTPAHIAGDGSMEGPAPSFIEDQSPSTTDFANSTSPEASNLPSVRKPAKKAAKELEEKRRLAAEAKVAARAQAALDAKEQSLARHSEFLSLHQGDKNKEAARKARIHNAVRTHTEEKEAKVTALNDPIAKAKERLQQQLMAASQLYKHNESVAPVALPPKPETTAGDGYDRSEDFHFVTNRAKRPLDHNAIVAKFLGGGISGGAVTSESHVNSGRKIASRDDGSSSVGFSFTPSTTRPQSPRGGYAQHPFVSNPYLAEALCHLDSEASQTYEVDALAAEAQRKLGHEKTSERYHQQVMEKIVDARVTYKLDSRRRQKAKAYDEAMELEAAQKAGTNVSVIPRQDGSRVDNATNRFVPRPLSETDVKGFAHLSARTSMARLYKNLGVLEFEPAGPPQRGGAIADILSNVDGAAGVSSNPSSPAGKSRSVALQSNEQFVHLSEAKEAEAARVARGKRGTIFTQVGKFGSTAIQPISSLPHATTQHIPSTVHIQDYAMERSAAKKVKLSANINAEGSAGEGIAPLMATTTLNKRRAMTAERDIGAISFQPAV